VDLNLDPFEKLVDRHVKMVRALFTGEHVDTIFLLILLSPCHDKRALKKDKVMNYTRYVYVNDALTKAFILQNVLSKGFHIQQQSYLEFIHTPLMVCSMRLPLKILFCVKGSQV
jgi:hypothetical protein